MTHVTCMLTAKKPGSAPEHYARLSSMGCLFTATTAVCTTTNKTVFANRLPFILFIQRNFKICNSPVVVWHRSIETGFARCLRVIHSFAYNYIRDFYQATARGRGQGAWLVSSSWRHYSFARSSSSGGRNPLLRGQSLRLSMGSSCKHCCWCGELINPFIRAGVVTSDDRFASGSGRRQRQATWPQHVTGHLPLGSRGRLLLPPPRNNCLDIRLSGYVGFDSKQQIIFIIFGYNGRWL